MVSNYFGSCVADRDGRADIPSVSCTFLTIHSRGTRIVPILVPLTQALDRCSALPVSRPARLRTSIVGPSAQNFRQRLVRDRSRALSALAAHVPSAAGRGDYVTQAGNASCARAAPLTAAVSASIQHLACWSQGAVVGDSRCARATQLPGPF